MTIRENTIVIRKDSKGYTGPRFRVEAVDGNYATMRSLETYMLTEDHIDELVVSYQVDHFEPGDIVRVRGEYQDKYSEAEGCNDLTVVSHSTGFRVPTTRVETNQGEEFTILTERIYLVRPAASFKAGDRVVIDPERMKKFDDDGIDYYWQNVGVMALTEDSGSRTVQTTSHVRYENKDPKTTNNVPTRWLKLYEEPIKRVVGETIKVEDVKVGDTIRATYTAGGLIVTLEGKVGSNVSYNGGEHVVTVDGGGAFPNSALNPVFTLLEEAPEPVDENLQRLLDAEVGDIAHGTYEDEYWKKTSKDHWQEIGGKERIGDTEGIFESLSKIKYGMLEIYRKVEDAN